MDPKGFFASLFDFSFSSFVTTKIIKVLYILAIIGAGIGALFVLFTGFASGRFFGVLFSFVLAPLYFVLGVILARVWLEIVIVLFRIAENTQKLADGKPPAPQA